MTKTIVFNTGRVYGGNQQFLNIAYYAEHSYSELNFDDVEVCFYDAARHIAGMVKLMGLEMDSNMSIGKAVLREYDAGRYTMI